VADNVRRVAAALDEREAGERIVARMEEDLTAARGAWGDRSALYLTPSGFTAGPGTLIDSVLAAAGLGNAATRPGFQPVSLERLVMNPPEALVLGFFDAFATAMERWGPGRHQVLQQLTRDKAIGSLPGSIAGCPGWFAADGARRLAEAAPR
jgi:iron complex transport system substrate-binding protein